MSSSGFGVRLQSHLLGGSGQVISGKPMIHSLRCRGIGLAIAGLVCIAATGLAQPMVPPPEPSVPPLIADAYSSDLDHDRIEDSLFGEVSRLETLAASALTLEEKAGATNQLARGADVELVFKQQITQDQINGFTARGGEITYIYRAVSYGWNGRLPLSQVKTMPALMGANLVLIQEAKPMRWHMDTATRTGRVRPIWAGGFAGNVSGFDGDASITIGIVDTGVDETHTDLNGRRVYWNDFSSDGFTSPTDLIQHGSHVAGIALGTGAAGGSGTGTMSYTDEGSLNGVRSGSFYPGPIELPAASVSFTMTARWNGGGSTTLYLVYHTKGASGGWTALNGTTGTSPLTLTTSVSGNSSLAYSAALISNGAMTDYVVANQVTSYQGAGDGFNKFRGVAPGCNWAGAKVFNNAGSGTSSAISAGVDGLVANRVADNIKVMNLSLGTIGSPGINTTLRQKINTAVNDGIVVAVSAGNDFGTNQVDDPGRAAMALTVAAANDVNQLTDYTSEGFSSPGSTPGQEEDYKPDLMAPGGSANYYSAILSVDSNSGDGAAFADQQANDYYNIQGTSMASPFAAGCAALVIDALQQSGVTWDFTSSRHSRFVKMVLCATASESNVNREGGSYNPTLQRATAGPNGFPVGKDQYEGYGMINPDAAVEAVSTTLSGLTSRTLGSGPTDRRAWATTVSLTSGRAFQANLTVPATGDFDLYLYSSTPSPYGTPVILAASTQAGLGVSEACTFTPASNTTALLVVKRISGSGTFSLLAPVSTSGTVAYYPASYNPPNDLSATRVGNVTMSLTGGTTLTTTTLADGSYGLINIPAGGTYCVTPSKADDSPPAHGVNVLDLLAIQKHIAAVASLDSPYKLLAADVNGDHKINVLDLLAMQRLIAAVTNSLPAGLWRFVPDDYSFANPQAPWDPPTNRWFTNVVADVTQEDFVAIKLGDVDKSWTAPVGQSVLATSIQGSQALAKDALTEVVFAVSRQSAQPGQTVAARVTVSGFDQVSGAQFSLAWDPAVLRYVGTGSYGVRGLSAGSFGTTLVASGRLGFVWFDPAAVGVTLADGTVLFTVSFEVIGHAGSVSTVTLAGSPTEAAVCVDDQLAPFGAQAGSIAVVGPAVLVSNPGYDNGEFRLSVPTEKGRSYVLEFTEALTPGKWTPLPAVTGDGTVKVLLDPAATTQQRFYRVHVY